MKILFPSHPLKSRLPDPDYEMEVKAARDAGFNCLFYNLELLREGNPAEACAAVAPADIPNQPILHRGWMMNDELYQQLCSELSLKGYSPVTSPSQYAEAHYLPYAYPHMVDLTPESGWITGKEMNEAWNLYQSFMSSPALVKDFVKSAKHKWNEACFIPPNTSRQSFEEIIRAFLAARGTQFNKGIVLCRYHDLVTLGQDLRGQPVHEEYRMFFWNGELLAATPAISGEGPFGELPKWTSVAKRFQNKFISMDVSRQADDTWIIIEVGDGGVSGLPTSIDPESFYKELRHRVSSSETEAV